MKDNCMSRRVNILAVPVALAALAFSGATVCAHPAHKKSLADYLGRFGHKKLEDCRTCHLPVKPGEAEDETEKPHNAFGARLKAVKKELARAGKSTDIAARLDA